MDRSKQQQQQKRNPKSKALQQPLDLIALGSNPAERKTSIASSSSGSSSQSTVQKKPKPSTSLDRVSSSSGIRDRAGSDVAAKPEAWESLAIDIDANKFIAGILEAEKEKDDTKLTGLLCGAVKFLRHYRSATKPDSSFCVALLFLAKSRPHLFRVDNVYNAFCSLLKKDSNATSSASSMVQSLKNKCSPTVPILVANVLLACYHDVNHWPESFIKVYLEDSISERIWVDQEECKGFVENIQTAFNTKIPPKSVLQADTMTSGPLNIFKAGNTCSSPVFGMEEDETGDNSNPESREKWADIGTHPRYVLTSDSAEQLALDMVREQFSQKRVQPIAVDGGISRSLLRTLTSLCGIGEIRFMVSTRLEIWLQNPKLARPAQDLLMSICMNCNQHNHQDIEVLGTLSKLRLKSKPLITHYIQCIKELLLVHEENFSTFLKYTLLNELSAQRNPNNMIIITTLQTHSSENTAKVIADVFFDLLLNKEDYLRALRALLREIVRCTRYEVNLPVFCSYLVAERKEINYTDLDSQLKERIFLAIGDLITLSIFLSISPNVREYAVAHSKNEFGAILRVFQTQVAGIQKDAVFWLHAIAHKTYRPGRTEFMHCLHKVMFMEQADHYYNKDNWPPENDRVLMLTLSSEVIVLEETLIRIVLMGLQKDPCVTAPDAVELCDQLIKRAARLSTNDEELPVLKFQRTDIFQMIFNLCIYKQPDNISLPHGYEAPDLAISSLYWKSWVMLLILSAHNPRTLGREAWDQFPNLRSLMEMCITNSFAFPPPTVAVSDKADEIKARELQTLQLEKQEILEFENHLASASTKQTITESNSHLLSQLTRLTPFETARRPSSSVLDQMKALNQSLKLGHLLCRSRDPDFLLDIINRQAPSSAMPWLSALVESNAGSFQNLPVQCLCEFLLNELILDGDYKSFENTRLSESEREDGSAKEDSRAEKLLKAHKLERRQKQVDLLRHLNKLVYHRGGKHNHLQMYEVLDFFLRRLGSHQLAPREQAKRGIRLIMEMNNDEDADQMEIDEAVDHNDWLIRRIPSVPNFDAIRIPICGLLRRACAVENDSSCFAAFVAFLAEYGDCDDHQEMTELALDVGKMVLGRRAMVTAITRPNTISCPISFDQPQNTRYSPLHALLIIMLRFLRKSRAANSTSLTWADSQEMVNVQWSTGEVASLHIIIPHACAQLLVFGSPATNLLDEEKQAYDELMEIWFPVNTEPPQAFLADTSEECLLYPDWLRLKMLSSNVEPLMKAALVDTEPLQLVLFLQSFGTPPAAVTRLLSKLDRITVKKSAIIPSLTFDRPYFRRMIKTQHLRGAVGGEHFLNFINRTDPDYTESEEALSTPLPSSLQPTLSSGDMDMTDNSSQKFADVSLTNDLFARFSDVGTVAFAQALIGLFDYPKPILSKKDKYELLRIIQKVLMSEVNSSTQVNLDKTIEHFTVAINSEQSSLFVDSLYKGASFSSAILKLFITIMNKLGKQSSKSQRLLNLFVRIYQSSNADSLDRQSKTVFSIIESVIKERCPTAVKQKEDCAVFKDGAFVDLRDVGRVTRDVFEEGLKKAALADERAMNGGIVVDYLTRNLNNNLKGDDDRGMRSLFLDWLEFLEPEIIGRNPELQRQLLFKEEETRIDEEAVCSNSPYLLSVVIHQSSWETLHNCVTAVLSTDSTDRFNSTAVLDFLWALTRKPSIWQGTEKSASKKAVPQTVFRLSFDQIVQMSRHVLKENFDFLTRKEHDSESCLSKLESRLVLLFHCLDEIERPYLLEKFVCHLERTTDDADNQYASAAGKLLLHMYILNPNIASFIVNEDKLFKDTRSIVNTSSELDVASHSLLTLLSTVELNRSWQDKVPDVEMACRKMAAHHPVLMCRQLSILSSALRCRADLDWNAFLSKRYLSFYCAIMSLLELMQPHVFKTEFILPLEDTIGSFMSVIKAYGHRQEVAILSRRFMQFVLTFTTHQSKHVIKRLSKYVEILKPVNFPFADIANVKSQLVSALSIQDGVSGENGESEEDSFSAINFKRSAPYSNSQMYAILAGLSSGSEQIEDICGALQEVRIMSKRQPDILELFQDVLMKFISSPIEAIRNIAYELAMKLLKINPRLADNFVLPLTCAFNSENACVSNAALEKLPEFAIMTNNKTQLLLENAFETAISKNLSSAQYLSEAILLLHMQAAS